MVAAGEIFTLDELKQLSKVQLMRVSTYLGVDVPLDASRNVMIDKIMDFQQPKHVIDGVEYVWDGNPDWKPGVQRSARVQRLYELNVLGKKL